MTITTHLAASRLEQQLDRALADLTAARRLLRAAVGRMDDACPGYPGGARGGGSGAQSASDGPLASAVVLADDALRDAATVERRLDELTSSSRNLLGLTQKWGITRHGSAEGVDERSLLCDSCGYNDRPEDRRVCQWCARTLKAINEIRGGLGRTPLARLPQPALDHVRNGRMRRVTPTDLDRWARGDRRNRS